MSDRDRMRERFERFPPAVRLGHLASDMHRLAGWAAAGRDDDTLVALMREVAWKMEWVGEASTEALADSQREICRWMRVRPLSAARSVLAFRAESMSALLLAMSGLDGTGPAAH